MKIEIEVISTQIIPPSSPTPNDISNYKLSFIDQLEAPAFMPLTLFYEATGSLTKSQISGHLKKSLSKTLSLYYPLTGRIVDNSYVINDDQGITYVEAQANCKLLEVVNKPIPEELVKLLPRNIDDVTDVCIIVQITFFNCGGVAIGVALSHKICDGWSLSLFVNSWAEISRGDAYIRSPIFEGATLFPPRDLGGFDPKCWMMMIKEDLVTKRFMFTSSKINELKDIYTNTTRATRIEALTAFIWTRFMVSTQTKDDPKRKFNLVIPIDIRKRAIPPLSDDLFGNFVQHAVPVLDGEEGTYTGVIVVEKMREAIRSIDGDSVNKLREGSQSFNFSNDPVNKYLSGEVEPFAFTSLCRFPLYEVDFGWGKQIWNGLVGSFHMNRVVFIDSVSGGGIEAWITFKSEDMAKFQADEEFLAYVAT